ncbi:unnamed protein product [Caenorhabditis bovis]|uniref:Intraflagellar transport protein 80 homolog n=1 Tax=Caenorhabditis bovis TaxID=2654633 RepID=A0A8S1FAA5_9PELO|nr:unnamed protein product [Caenorhabditis bovis]
MKLKLVSSRSFRHHESVYAVGWSGPEQILSIGDDHQLLRTNTTTNETTLVANMDENFFPTTLHMFPRPQNKDGSSDLLAVSTTNGKVHILSKSTGKSEKSIDAHTGAVLHARWNSDGTGLLTGGEDGFVKMWSRNGMLRSVLAQFPTAVYSVAWDSSSSSVLYTNSDHCYIKSLRMQVAPLKWKAHDGIVLCCDWSPTSALIITGGEDCKFKLWDGFGQILFSSSVHDYPITSLAWCGDGTLFSVGSHNILRLCDKSGWSHSLEKMSGGSVTALSWSPDGTQLAIATASGQMFHSHIIDKRLTYQNFEVVQTQRTVIEVRDVSNEIAKEKLETKERISKISILYDHLLVVTNSFIYIYSSKNWNTPIIVDFKEMPVNLIIQCEKLFLVSDGLTVIIMSYEGRKLSTINPPGHALALLEAKTVSLSMDTIAIQDRGDPKIVHFFEPNTGKSQGDGSHNHEYDIVELTINQCGALNDRLMAFRDQIGAVYILIVKTFGLNQRISRIGSLIEQLKFNDVTNMLCGVTEGKIAIWPLPNIAFFDRSLMQKATIMKNVGNLGKFPQLISFSSNTIIVRKSDGSLIPVGISPFAGTIVQMANESKWDQAIRLGRNINDDTLWALLAGVALLHKNMYAAETAYAALNEAEKVAMINEVKENSDKNVRHAMQILLTGRIGDAEVYLERNGHPFRALMINIQMFRWKRALEIALKSKDFLEVVMGYRAKYLQNIGKKESDPMFLKHMAEVEVDWIHIREIIDGEKAKGNY